MIDNGSRAPLGSIPSGLMQAQRADDSDSWQRAERAHAQMERGKAERDAAIRDLLADGYSLRTIANRIGISFSGVRYIGRHADKGDD